MDSLRFPPGEQVPTEGTRVEAAFGSEGTTREASGVPFLRKDVACLSCPNSAGTLMSELWRWRGPSGLRWVWRNGRGPHLEVSMGFSSQEYWSGLPYPSPGDLPDPGIEPWPRALQTDLVSNAGFPAVLSPGWLVSLGSEPGGLAPGSVLLIT